MNHFGFTKLLVNDLEKSATFYKDVCGLTELAHVDAEITGRKIKEIMFNATAPGGSTFVLVKFLDTTKSFSDEVIIGFTKKAGGKVAEEIQSQPEHGVKVAFVTDIEGHLIEVVELLNQ